MSILLNKNDTTRLMPLKRVVLEVTNEAIPDDPQSTKKAIKSWHNRLSNGSIPRSIITKLGKELFLNLNAWEVWLSERDQDKVKPGRGRPRTT